jgi:type IV pilus assembly protein PilE
MRSRQQGFTLMEMMIVVAIVAILAYIAVPSYQDYVRRSKLTDATSQLGDLRVRLEQFYQDNRNYGSTAAACGVPMPTGEAAKHFTFSCNWGAGGTNQSFLVTATGNAAQGMSGYAFTISETNAKQTTAFPGATGLPRNCWILRAGDAC